MIFSVLALMLSFPPISLFASESLLGELPPPRLLHKFPDRTETIFSQGGSHLLMAWRNRLILYDWQTQSEVKRLEPSVRGPVHVVKEEQIIFRGSAGLESWNPQTGKVAQVPTPFPFWKRGLLSEDGSFMLASHFVSSSNFLLGWDPRTQNQIWKVNLDPRESIDPAALSPNGDSFLTIDYTNYSVYVGVRSTKDGRLLKRIEDLGPEGASFSPGGTKFTVFGVHYPRNEYAAAIYDAKSFELLAILSSGEHRIAAAEFNRDESMIVTGSTDGMAVLWNARNGEKLRTFKHSSKIGSVSFHPDGRHVALGCEDGSVFIWKIGYTDTELREMASRLRRKTRSNSGSQSSETAEKRFKLPWSRQRDDR